jgi:hypothetical protein
LYETYFFSIFKGFQFFQEFPAISRLTYGSLVVYRMTARFTRSQPELPKKPAPKLLKSRTFQNKIA